mmetsp:Transcript_42039/g.91650  ORF Transcript_42039/g.91650 Transcript_42039/m.91650 type:complete len:233 (-) Transcript_42039:847-1545(-)
MERWNPLPERPLRQYYCLELEADTTKPHVPALLAQVVENKHDDDEHQEAPQNGDQELPTHAPLTHSRCPGALAHCLVAEGHKVDHSCAGDADVHDSCWQLHIAVFEVEGDLPFPLWSGAVSPRVARPLTLPSGRGDQRARGELVADHVDVHLVLVEAKEASLGDGGPIGMPDCVLVKEGLPGRGNVVLLDGGHDALSETGHLHHSLLDRVAHHTQAVEELEVKTVQRELLLQ